MGKKMTKKQVFYSGVITGAVEGGIGYWSWTRNYHWEADDETPTTAEIFDFESDGYLDGSDDPDDDTKWLKLDNKVIAKAFKLIVGKGEIEYAGKQWRKRMTKAYFANDSGELDAGDADMVVQIGLFGKVVYG